jgi:hypothetical protein
MKFTNDKEEKLLHAFIELRGRFTVEDLWLIFTTRKAEAFESLRIKFFNKTEVYNG